NDSYLRRTPFTELCGLDLMIRLDSKSRRRQIALLALEIIAKEGLPELTMRKLAGRAQVSEAAIYRHFKNKEAVLRELFELLAVGNGFWQTAKVADDPIVGLKLIIEAQLSHFENNPDLITFLFNEEVFVGYPALKEPMLEWRKTKEETIIDLVETAKRQNQVPADIDSKVFALLYMGAIRLIALKWK
ncbi:MAG: TetR/AcrR family transcriptional regulator, partial [Actinomycetota bacterium]|nr:TetR/AcrR family transcriptional regulator [Actinomycetota bacterium]